MSLLNLQAETVQAPQVHEIFMVSKQRKTMSGACPSPSVEYARSLGLTIVRTLAKQLGGTVDVQRGVGARFYVTFANKP